MRQKEVHAALLSLQLKTEQQKTAAPTQAIEHRPTQMAAEDGLRPKAFKK